LRDGNDDDMMDNTQKQAARRAAARAAARLVEPGMTVGLGSGSTASLFIEALAERVRDEGLTLRAGVPTSRAAGEQAARLGLPVLPLGSAARPDLTVDGADEADPDLALIKGGGGALVQEKLVAVASRELVIVADADKAVATLGAFPLPVAVVPFGWETTRERVVAAVGQEDVPAARRETGGAGEPFVTDDGLYILDLRVGRIPDPAALERALKQIVGVVDCGLFTGLASRVLFGQADGSVVERVRRAA
jgi:ribose 5-phosphate isomerase A